MRLYVMRHGPAEDRAPTGRDFDRALTVAGREVVARAARRLFANHPPIARILASPFRRAQQTAEIVASLAPSPLDIEVHPDLGADSELPTRLVHDVGEAGADALLVGHQPIVEELVRLLVHPAGHDRGRPGAAGVRMPSGFRTGTIVALHAVVDPPGRTAWTASGVVDPHHDEG